ncbi:GNAT family N-acetyltransferase [Salinisphaera sp. Q1T1-3]|uniref:GNAT family N-acetyltransferase n=1 Tax=Salinisphaera sp. Q1T1-3 TaxID=2321229 RepID=UPI000E7382FD|nr:GNAT family N-acetyltransferase [Salinisphaera sp. Q1T1-3]RJS91625.1 GNAT family N-acetyltransferase [Salinisphaera sp. Q1T1-3]
MNVDAHATVRAARSDDAPTILSFIRELAIYEAAEHEVVATESDIEARLFGSDANVHALIAEDADGPQGFAVYFLSFSTWLGRHGIFLEDLYVTPAARGAGIGLLLLKHLAGMAVANGYGRFEWNVLDWNTPAIGFYESIGAKPQSEWIGYRLEGEALAAFARA